MSIQERLLTTAVFLCLSATMKKLASWTPSQLLPRLPPSSSKATAKAEHNASIPAAVLPPEILSHVFLILCQDCLPPDYSWIATSQVCASWRAAALATQALWTHLVFRSPAWITRCISRTGTQLLIVQTTIGSDAGLKMVLDVLERYRARIVAICLAVYESWSQPYLWKYLAGDFPAVVIKRYSDWSVPKLYE